MRFLKKSLRYLYVSIQMSVFRSMEYRTGVAIQYLLDFAWYIVQFALLMTAYNYVPQLGEYTLKDSYVFMAMLFTTDAVNMMFFNGGIDHFTRSIRNGSLEFYLLKPMPALFQLSLSRINLAGIGNVFFTFAFWIYVGVRFDLHYEWQRWLWAIALYANGMILNVAIRLLVSCIAFWTTESSNLSWLFHELMRFGNKPENIYGRPFKQMLTTFLPALLVTAWPCMALVKEVSLLELTYPFAISAVFLGALTIVWHLGVKRFEGISFQA